MAAKKTKVNFPYVDTPSNQEKRCTNLGTNIPLVQVFHNGNSILVLKFPLIRQ